MSKRKSQDNSRFYYIVAAALVIGIGFIVLSSLSGGRTAAPPPDDTALGEGGIDLTTGISIGADNAPIVIAEWSDYQCPYCGVSATDTFPQLKEAYIDTGQVRYIAKDFPLGGHPQAAPAAEYINCAVDQGKYWELRFEAFSRQQEWSGQRNFLDKLESYASALGLDTVAMNSCFKASEKRAAIQETKREGERLNITGTPTMFVNGRRIGGYMPFEDLEELLAEVKADAGQ